MVVMGATPPDEIEALGVFGGVHTRAAIRFLCPMGPRKITDYDLEYNTPVDGPPVTIRVTREWDTGVMTMDVVASSAACFNQGYMVACRNWATMLVIKHQQDQMQAQTQTRACARKGGRVTRLSLRLPLPRAFSV